MVAEMYKGENQRVQLYKGGDDTSHPGAPHTEKAHCFPLCGLPVGNKDLLKAILGFLSFHI